MHLRTHARIDQAAIPLSDRVHSLELLECFDSLGLQANSGMVPNDSGGVQEETRVLDVLSLNLQDNRERPATIEYGASRLAGTRKGAILEAWNQSLADRSKGLIPPLWGGPAGPRAYAALQQFLLGQSATELHTQ